LKPAEFWVLTIPELWWLLDQKTPEPTYGVKHKLTGSEVSGIIEDLKAKGLRSKWRQSQ
jgi:hypothetical protein